MDPIVQSKDEVHSHGMAINDKDKEIQCVYCGKIVSRWNRLQHHLAGIQGNVVECLRVPEDVKKFFKESLISAKMSRVNKDVGEIRHPESPRKRSCTSNGKASEPMIRNVASSLNDQPRVPNPRFRNSTTFERNFRKLSSDYNDRLHSEKGFAKQGQDSASIMAKRCMAKFFFENVVDFGAVGSNSFKSMMEITQKSGETLCCFPSTAELKGWILDDELVDIQNYVNEVSLSWPVTGCSILLDEWIDHSGRSLLNIIVDCPAGPIYLRSADVSPSTKGDDALQQLLASALEEVGVRNVVQIINHRWSESLENFGKQFIEKYRSLFWTVSTNCCLSLMLEKIAMTDSIKLTLDNAKIVTKFIYNHADLLQLLRRYIISDNLVIPSKIKVASSFMTLHKILLERSNLQRMFTSSEWLNSPWASTIEGKKVADLMNDNSFWNCVLIAARSSIPLVKTMCLINQGDMPTMGFIYETLDQAKETICKDLDGKKSLYMPIWNIIDEIWNPILHSDLHAAGYFLNPSYKYTDGFCSDSEVITGLLVTIVRMHEDRGVQDSTTQQLTYYGECKDRFKEGTEDNNHHKLSPAIWWREFGDGCPDLQNFAIKVLSQTTVGAETYELRRDLVEKLLSTGRNPIEQQRLHDLTYVHYNLKLKQFKMGKKFDIMANEIDATDDWIVGESPLPNLADPGSGDHPVETPDCVIISTDDFHASTQNGSTLKYIDG